MPLQRCTVGGRSGWKWGSSGKCYTGSAAKRKAAKQGAAVRATGWTENAAMLSTGWARNGEVRTIIVASNPLKADPTRTKTLRMDFERELSKRFNELRRRVRRLVVDEDAFGLRLSRNQLGTANIRFAFETAPEQIDKYEEWLRQQADEVLLSKEDAYWEYYAAKSYEKGAGRAFDDTYRARRAQAGTDEQMAYYRGSKEQFLREAFGQAETIDKLKLLAGRTFADLKNVNEAMATQMRRALTDGLAQGANPLMVAKSLTDVLDGNELRARTVARTEIIRAHAEGQLDAMERMGVAEVGVMVEWSSAGDDRVCPLCQDMDGVVLTIQEARGLIPRHPNCRCAHVPANVGEPKDAKRRVNYGDGSQSVGQKRSKEEIQSAIRSSIGKEGSKKLSIEERIRRSRWAGADKTIAKTRPKSPLYRSKK